MITNYDVEFEKTLKTIKENGLKVLLQVCCAPCFSGVYERLKGVDYSLYFYNPNITDETEYYKRLKELKRFSSEVFFDGRDGDGKDCGLDCAGGGSNLGGGVGGSGLDGGGFVGGAKEIIDGGFDNSIFFDAVKGLEKEKEGGKRCKACCSLRLKKTALLAKELGFDYFATTLTVSPYKNAAYLNEAGFDACREYGVKYLPSDFKKRGGYAKSIENSKKYGLYRQNYCGCVFSKQAREEHEKEKNFTD